MGFDIRIISIPNLTTSPQENIKNNSPKSSPMSFKEALLEALEGDVKGGNNNTDAFVSNKSS